MLEIYNLGEWLEFEPEILVLGSSFAKANVNHFVLEDMFNTTKITSLLDVKMPYLALPKCYCCEYIEKLINELKIFLRGKNRIALLGNGNIAKIIKLLLFKEFIIFDDVNYDNKYVFSTNLINKFEVDGVVQTYFGEKLNINKPYFKISENFRILHTCLKMYFSVYKNFDIRKFV